MQPSVFRKVDECFASLSLQVLWIYHSTYNLLKKKKKYHNWLCYAYKFDKGNLPSAEVGNREDIVRVCLSDEEYILLSDVWAAALVVVAIAVVGCVGEVVCSVMQASK